MKIRQGKAKMYAQAVFRICASHNETQFRYRQNDTVVQRE